ncbi:probable maltase [Anabrus simplex]|uniref:probable maltase n=1 Tax=Anabrus simplex TaxID=316456 RepID=UPI0035A2BEDC
MDSGRENEREADGSTHLLAEDSSNHMPDDKMIQENDDGATDKLMPEDDKFRSNKEAIEVKFISAGSQNGDAKIDIENMKVAFAGMGKEELMKFANDPFWIRMRWFLFILFWLLWAGMLAGAIAIIVMAPKCPAPPPLEWWEESPLYQVYVRSFKDGSDPQDGIGDLRGLKSEKSLDYIKSLGVKGIILSPVLRTSSENSDSVENFKDINPIFGTLKDFEELAKALKERDLHLVMNLVPNHSSKNHTWFIKSEEKEDPYTNYYIWKKGPRNETGQFIPPNNWKSIYGGSAWEWSSKRQEFYLHQFHVDQPDLNFRNENVTNEFKDILSFWLDRGASGFEFDKIQYLLEDEHFRNATPGDVMGTTHDQYEFYSHKSTAFFTEVLNILSDWREVFENRTSGMFSVTHSFKDPLLRNYGNNSIVDVVRYTDIFSSLQATFTADDLYNAIEKWRDDRTVPNSVRRYWELGNFNTSRVASRFSPEVVDGLNMVVMLMQGTPVTYYGEELGMKDNDDTEVNFARSPFSWENSTNAGFSEESPWTSLSSNYEEANVELESKASDSHLSVYKSLVKARSNPSIMYGEFESAVYNGSVYAFTRLKSGNPGYLVAFNPGENDETVSFMNFSNMADDLTVIIRSSNLKGQMEPPSSDAVYIPAKAAFVATFVPKQK